MEEMFRSSSSETEEKIKELERTIMRIRICSILDSIAILLLAIANIVD